MSDNDPQIMTFGPRRRGRPRLSLTSRSIQVSVVLPESDFDEACKTANGLDVSLPEVFRRALKRFLADERSAIIKVRK